MENKFEYTYSAPRNEEIEEIRKKYASQTSAESKLKQIRRFDKSVESEGMIRSPAVGIAGALILGLGMCCTMVWTNLFVLGIILGIIGMVICGCAFSLYKNTITKNVRKQLLRS